MSYQPKRMKNNDSSSNRKNSYNTKNYNYKEKPAGYKIKKSKKSSKFDIVLKILALAYVIITIIFYTSILRLNLLPNNFVAIFTIAEIIFTLLIGIGLAKKHKTYKLNIFCLIIALLVSGVYLYVANYANATTDFLGTMFTEVQETDEYYVVVRSNSNYDSIDDIEGEEVYSFQVTEDIKAELSNKVDISFDTADSLTGLGNILLDGEIDVIFVSSSQYSMLSEEIENFEGNTKIIYTSTHEVESVAEITTENSNYTINNGIFNVYISGIDTSGSISNVSRSDANIIATVNTNTHEVLLTSIPRDYYVTLHSKGARDKLTHSGIYGINETVTTVEDLLDIDINYYVRVNFTTVINLVDTLGGIEVYSDYDFSTGSYHFNAGYNYLDGEEALAFSRERHAFASGDNQRVKNQQAVIEAIIKKVLNSTTLLTRYTNILESLEGSFQTNIDQSEISNLVKDQLNNMSSWTIRNNSLTGTGAYRSTYSLGSLQSYVMIPDDSSVAEAKNEIDDVLGE